MKLKRLTLNNIRSYQNQEIEFPSGSLLLAGDIGSGKTSLLLAIEYALFGLQPGQKGSSLLRNDATEGAVSLELEVKDSSLLIERRLRRGSKGVSNEFAAVTINGVRHESSITEIKTKILQALGYPSEFIKKNNLLYRYTVYTPQEQMKQIILEDEETRLNIIRHIFGIDKYKRVRENLSILLLWIKEESKSLQGEIKTLDEDKTKLHSIKSFFFILETKIKEKISILEQKITYRKHAELNFLELENKFKEKQLLEKDIEKIQLLITTRQESLSSMKKEAEETQKNISQIIPFDENQYAEIINQISNQIQKIESFQKEQIETSAQLNSLDKSKQENLQRKERFFTMDLCQTCLQDVPDDHKHNILNATESNLAQIKTQTELLQERNSQILEQIQNEKKQKDIFDEKKVSLEILKSKTQLLQDSKSKLLSINQKKEDLQKDILSLHENISKTKEQILEFSDLDNSFSQKKQALKLTLQEEKETEISLAELKKERDITKKEISSLEETILKKEGIKSKLSNLLELSDWLSSQFLSLIEFTERNVLMKLRLEFSEVFNSWFSILVPFDSLSVQLDDSFSPIIIQKEIEMPYEFLSGGERTAVALAYRLALNQTINSVLSRIKTKELVILDEPTDGFSESQIDKMRDLFSELNVSQLIVVSHEQKIESFVDNIIKIKKQGETSSIELSNTPSHQ